MVEQDCFQPQVKCGHSVEDGLLMEICTGIVEFAYIGDNRWIGTCPKCGVKLIQEPTVIWEINKSE